MDILGVDRTGEQDTGSPQKRQRRETREREANVDRKHIAHVEAE